MPDKGTWRPFLDEVVLKGARAYALLMLAIKAEHQAKVDVASARTRLGSIAAIHTLVGTALAKIATHVAEADAALDKVDIHITTDAETAYDAVGTEITLAKTALTNAVVELGKVNTDATASEAVWTDEVKYISGATGPPIITGAQPYLETGDDKINLVNIGDKVAELYATYALRENEIAALWSDKRKDFLIEAQRHVDTMNGYLEEASHRINIARSRNEEGAGRIQMSLGFIQEAQQRLGMAQEYSRESQMRVAEMASYVAEAERYQTLAEQELQISDRYRTEGALQLTEFNKVLEDRAQYRTSVSVASVRQPR